MTQENTKLISAVINTLDSISVPNIYVESVIIPVYNCSRALKQILERETKDQQNVENEELPKEETVNDTADSVE